jgi:hypothetical protein
MSQLAGGAMEDGNAAVYIHNKTQGHSAPRNPQVKFFDSEQQGGGGLFLLLFQVSTIFLCDWEIWSMHL